MVLHGSLLTNPGGVGALPGSGVVLLDSGAGPAEDRGEVFGHVLRDG